MEITLAEYNDLPVDSNGEGKLYRPYAIHQEVGDKVTIFEKLATGSKHLFRAEVLQYTIVEE